MENFIALVIGIVSSLIATAVFVSLSELTRRVLLPWYADKIYRGIRVDGKWEDVRTKNIAGDTFSTFNLKQKGEKISGIYSHGYNRGTSITHYQVEGVLRDTYLTAIARPLDNDVMDGLAFLFRVFHGESGLHMKGYIAYISSDGTVKQSDKEIIKEK